MAVMPAQDRLLWSSSRRQVSSLFADNGTMVINRRPAAVTAELQSASPRKDREGASRSRGMSSGL